MNLEVVKIKDIKPRKELFGTLAIPSTAHSYSLCVEYVKNWFIRRFDRFKNGYFSDSKKNIYIDGKYIMDDYIRLSDIERIKRPKPNLAITPALDQMFNNEMVDPNMLGIDNYIRRSAWETPFFSDPNNNLNLIIKSQLMVFNFNFRVRVATRAEQLDTWSFMKTAYRVGFTSAEYVDVDFHVPYQLMITLAQDAGFEVKNGSVVNILEFMHYLNTNSELPFLYKLRGINGRNEFFVKLRDVYIHTRVNDIDYDNGEREGQTSNNFNIEMSSVVRFPAPHFFLYYAEIGHSRIEATITGADAESLGLYALKITQFPELDEHGWALMMTTDIEEPDHSKPLSINIAELFESEDGTDIQYILEYNKQMAIDSSIFLNIKLYNDAEFVPCSIDWNTMELTTEKLPISDITNMGLYVNKAYMNEQMITLKEYNKSRIN